MQTKGAIGNLINRYRAVLKKCNLLNTFGTLAIASALAMGAVTAVVQPGIAMAASGASFSDNELKLVSGASASSFGIVFGGDGTTDGEFSGSSFTVNKITYSGAATLGTVTVGRDTVANVVLNADNYASTGAVTVAASGANGSGLTFDGNNLYTVTGAANAAATINLTGQAGDGAGAVLTVGEKARLKLVNASGSLANVIDGTTANTTNQQLVVNGTLISADTAGSAVHGLTIGNNNGAVVAVGEKGGIVAGALTVDNGSSLTVNGDIELDSAIADTDYNVTNGAAYTKGVLANSLTVDNGSEVSATNVTVGDGATLTITDGLLDISETLTLDNAITHAGNPGIMKFKTLAGSKDLTLNGGGVIVTGTQATLVNTGKGDADDAKAELIYGADGGALSVDGTLKFSGFEDAGANTSTLNAANATALTADYFDFGRDFTLYASDASSLIVATQENGSSEFLSNNLTLSGTAAATLQLGNAQEAATGETVAKDTANYSTSKTITLGSSGSIMADRGGNWTLANVQAAGANAAIDVDEFKYQDANPDTQYAGTNLTVKKLGVEGNGAELDVTVAGANTATGFTANDVNVVSGSLAVTQTGNGFVTLQDVAVEEHGELTMTAVGGDQFKVGKLNLKNGASGSVTAGTVAVSDLQYAQGAVLTVANGAILDAGTSSITVAANEVANTGRELNVSGSLNLAGLNLTADTAATSELSFTGGTINVDTLSFKSASGGNNLIFKSGTLGVDSSISAAQLTVGDEAANNTAVLNLYDNGTFAGKLLVTGSGAGNHGSAAVIGDWSINEVNVAANGALDVNQAATLTVNNKLENAGAITVANLGTLETNAKALGYARDENGDLQLGTQIGTALTVNGTLAVSGLGTISQDDLTEIKADLFDGASNGLLDIAEAAISDAATSEGVLGTNVDYASVQGVTSDVLKDTVVNVANATLAAGLQGGYAGIQAQDAVPAADENGTAAFTVADNSTLLLTGNNGALAQAVITYQDENGDDVNKTINMDANIGNGSTLTVGVADKANAGELGDVTFTALGGTFNSVNGDFTVASIDDGRNNGTVNVQGGKLVSLGNVKVNRINAAGELQATGLVDAGNINLENGSVAVKYDDPKKEGVNNAGFEGSLTAQTIAGSGNIVADGFVNVTDNNAVLGDTLTITAGNKALDIDGTLLEDGSAFAANGGNAVAFDGALTASADIEGNASSVTVKAVNGNIAAQVLTADGASALALQAEKGSIAAGAVTVGTAGEADAANVLLTAASDVTAGAVAVHEGASFGAFAGGDVTLGQINAQDANLVAISAGENLSFAGGEITNGAIAAQSFDVNGALILNGGNLASSAALEGNAGGAAVENSFTDLAARYGAQVALAGETALNTLTVGLVQNAAGAQPGDYEADTLHSSAVIDKVVSNNAAFTVGVHELTQEELNAGHKAPGQYGSAFLQVKDSSATGLRFTAIENGTISIGSMTKENIQKQLAFAQAGGAKYNSVAAISVGSTLQSNDIAGLNIGDLGVQNPLNAAYNIGNGGLLIVDVNAPKDADGNRTAVINAAGQNGFAFAAEGAGIQLAGAQAGQTYVIAEDVTNAEGAVDNVAFTTDNKLVIVKDNVAADAAAGTAAVINKGFLDQNKDDAIAQVDFIVNTAFDSNSPILGYMSPELHGLMANFAYAGLGSNSFLGHLMDANNGYTAAQIGQAVESAAKAPMVVGAPTTAVSVATMGADYAMARTSFAPRVAGAAAVAENGEYTNISAGDNMANGMNLWIMPMYQNSSADGFQSGSYELAFDSDFAGVAVGADYTWDNSFRLGATINMGTGSAESAGSLAYTENDYDSFGVGIYAGYMLGNLGLSADVNYTNISNEISQRNIGGALSADGDTNVWSVGVRAEYKIATELMDIVPHIGLRYSNISIDSMNFSGVLTADADSANVWQLPIGVTFAKDIVTDGGWTFTPALDLSIIPAFGDTEMAQTVQFTGVNGIASMNTEIMDSVSGRAQVGFELSKDQFYMGLDYAYQGSSNMDTHGVQATFGFKF